MKNISLLFVVMLLFSGNTNAQIKVLKLGLTNLLIGDFNASYEWTPKKHPDISFSGHLGFRPDFSSQSLSENTNLIINFQRLGYGFEWRYYTNIEKPVPTGFYVSLYNNSRFFKFDIIERESREDANFNGKLRQGTLGLQIGNQWLINDRIAIDFTFFGIGYTLGNLEFTYTNTNLNTDYRLKAEELTDTLGDIIYLNQSEFELEEESYNYTSSIFYPNLRFALSIGIAL